MLEAPVKTSGIEQSETREWDLLSCELRTTIVDIESGRSSKSRALMEG